MALVLFSDLPIYFFEAVPLVSNALENFYQEMNMGC